MFLVLDFTQSPQLAIFDNDKFTGKELKTKKYLSEILIIEIDKFLKKTKTNIKKIKSICIVTGPGSFTGIRTALTYAKSLKLITKLNIFGLSKFEIINSKIDISKFNNKKCILLHFKDDQYFVQNYKGYNPLDEVRLHNFSDEKFIYNKQTTYFYDNTSLEGLLSKKIRVSIENNFYLIDYNLVELQEIILKNTVDYSDPKPLYISNYY